MTTLTATKALPQGYVTWRVPEVRGKLTLAPGDVQTACRWYQQEFGVPPVLALIHPKVEALAAEAPAGVEVRISNMALASEVMLAAVSKVPTYRDIAVCNAGGFFCQACVAGKPASEQSPDLRYCKDCEKVVAADKAIAKQDKDGWEGGFSNIGGRSVWLGGAFVTGGKRYGVAKSGKTICLGPVTPSAGKASAERPQDGGQVAQGVDQVVLKQQDKGITIPIIPALVLKQDGGHILPDAVKVDQDTVSRKPKKDALSDILEALPKSQKLSKHAGGRPKKRGEDVSRATKWRREREKEKQGTLQLP